MYEFRLLLLGLLAWLCTAASAASPAQAGPQPVVDREFVVVLDPGHGGTNRGCASSDGRTHEKEVTLTVARELKAEIQRRLPHARIVLTRNRDETLTLAERVTLANATGADLFVSIHANASETRTQHGFETYLLDARASGLEAARTARRENDEGHTTPVAASAVDIMLRQLTLTNHRNRAAVLARAIQDEQSSRFPGRLDRGVKQAPFDVLMGARMPAVLFEVGFLDHPQDGQMLLDQASRARVVDGLAVAVGQYYREVSRRG
jgi:N-acetylmuramoyl-L-alanine amidase